MSLALGALIGAYRRTRDRLMPRGTRRRMAWARAVGVVKRLVGADLAAPSPEQQYRRWLQRNEVGPRDLVRMRKDARSLSEGPLFSILVAVRGAREALIHECIESVERQIYGRWELCIVQDGAAEPHVSAALAKHQRRDARIKVSTAADGGAKAVALSLALEMARGELVALLGPEDRLAPEALLEVAKRFEKEPGLDLVYSDEDQLDAGGRRVEPFFKPDWSPELFLSMAYACRLAVARRAAVKAAGGFRPGFEGTEDYDLLLRLVERTERIGHVPKVLYHRRQAAGPAAASGRDAGADVAAKSALESALARRNEPGEVERVGPGIFRVRYAIRGDPLVSIIIPTRDRVGLLRNCIESIEAKTRYRNFEILVVDNDSSDPETLQYLRHVGGKHRVLPYHAPFNWSAINNFAARSARGEHLLFLNNDMEVISPGWLAALLEHSQRPPVGAVGAKLVYPDGTIQHAGVITGIAGLADHAFRSLPADAPGYCSLASVIRNCSAVTGACMMVRREVFEQEGGFDEKLRVAFNDVDFCLRLRERGYRNVYTPYAALHHFESVSRGKSHPREDEALLVERWKKRLAADPCYNPNLSQDHLDFRLA